MPKEKVDKHKCELWGHLEDTFTQACTGLGQAAQCQKLYYDVKASGERYKPGDAVWLLNKDRRKDVRAKLQKKWKGPALVEDCVNDVTYCLRISPEAHKAVHFDSNLTLVKTYLGRCNPYARTIRTWRQDNLHNRY